MIVEAGLTFAAFTAYGTAASFVCDPFVEKLGYCKGFARNVTIGVAGGAAAATGATLLIGGALFLGLTPEMAQKALPFLFPLSGITQKGTLPWPFWAFAAMPAYAAVDEFVTNRLMKKAGIPRPSLRRQENKKPVAKSKCAL